MNELTEAERAYLAGLIDGEGCITITKQARKDTPTPVYQMVLVISQNDGDFLSHWQDRTGIGSVNSGNSAGGYQWRCSAANAARLLEQVYDYLVVKKDQAALALEFQKTMGAGYGGSGTKTPADVVDNRERYRNRIMAKNRNTANKGKWQRFFQCR